MESVFKRVRLSSPNLETLKLSNLDEVQGGKVNGRGGVSDYTLTRTFAFPTQKFVKFESFILRSF